MQINEKYAISPYHLSLLKPYELLDFVDFPFLVVDISPDAEYYLNYFVKHENEEDHRLLTEISYVRLYLLKNGLISVDEIFRQPEAKHAFYCICDQKGTIQKAYQLPESELLDNSIQKDYFLELTGEYEEIAKLTPYHAKYFAYELTKRNASDSTDKLASALTDAQVELNPHQVDAALFAFNSPLSKGVILADEVGLGKTIEAGLVISQKWAERKRSILIIVPANLRKQWNQELLDKFFLPSLILENKSFNDETRAQNFNPFDQKNKVVICSYHFIKSKENFVRGINWDLVVIDEAHRLRNVYKPTNKIANIIKGAISHVNKKILLTATPLQNSLMELFGLVSLIDDFAFGSQKSFRSEYTNADEGDVNYAELKSRLAPLCKRTLRKQVLQYVPYTDRISHTEEFQSSVEEHKLYNLVSEYLQTEKLYALPASQRQLMTLILRRLLASSTYAITGTLEALSKKLAEIVKTQKGNTEAIENVLQDDYEGYQEQKDDWQASENENSEEQEGDDVPKLTEEDIAGINAEIGELKEFIALAKSIQKDSKGEKLMTALKKGLEEATKRGAQQKALIFTESTRTQLYINDILQKTEFAGKIVLFNGSNNDSNTKEIYKKWLEKHNGTDRVSGSKSADTRAALVEYFRDEAEIMIATEAAAEGINLQFCSLVVNYDLPWNPQRIEQRIGRCHRYGQKHDVVVVNFLNTKNEADVRVYELLKHKFKLFDNVFGASDEVLGKIESGIDFERRIADIYQRSRGSDQIKIAFDKLRGDLEEEITNEVKKAKQSLLENVDTEVIEKMRLRETESEQILNRYETWLWDLTVQFLKDKADYSENNFSFSLKQNPFPAIEINTGKYRIGKNIQDANVYRINHPLAQGIISETKHIHLPVREIVFDYTNTPRKISIIENLKQQAGWLMVSNVTYKGFEEEDKLIFAGFTDKGEWLDNETGSRFFSVLAKEGKEGIPIPELVSQDLNERREHLTNEFLQEIGQKNNYFFQLEVDKLHHWADDKAKAAEKELTDTKQRIKELNREAKKTKDVQQQLTIQKDLSQLTALQKKLRQNIFNLEDEIQAERDRMIAAIEQRLNINTQKGDLFIIRWIVI